MKSTGGGGREGGRWDIQGREPGEIGNKFCNIVQLLNRKSTQSLEPLRKVHGSTRRGKWKIQTTLCASPPAPLCRSTLTYT